jgi:hypothetical protein
MEMTFISVSKFEDELAREFMYGTITEYDAVDVFATFSNGYTVEILRNHNLIFVEISRGECKLSYSDHIDTDGAFVYKDEELITLINAVANAETDFDVGFAYGRLTQKRGGEANE